VLAYYLFVCPSPWRQYDAYYGGLRVLTTRYRRCTALGGRSIWENGLDGTLPAELGKLTDLESLCAAAAAQPIGGTGRRRAIMRSGGVQTVAAEQVQRHDRQLDRLDGEANLAVSAPLRTGFRRAHCGDGVGTPTVLGVLEYDATGRGTRAFRGTQRVVCGIVGYSPGTVRVRYRAVGTGEALVRLWGRGGATRQLARTADRGTKERPSRRAPL
jgi:hypothetical protein